MRGVILLLVIWVLALISILAVVFISSAQAERSVTRNFTEEAIAKSLAQSGIEYGLSKIQTTLQRGFFDSNGKMEDYWNTEKILDASQSGLEGQIKINIQDLQGKINVNDGVGYPKTHSINKNLERVLNVLGDLVGINKLGEILVGNRPQQGYAGEFDLVRALGTNYEKVKRHVTIHSWRNDKVANPVPISEFEDSALPYPIKFTRPADLTGKLIYRRGQNRDCKGNRITNQLTFNKALQPNDFLRSNASAIFSHDALNPQWIEIVSRSPVNVNTASKEVLIALITDLAGFYVQERRLPAPPFMNLGPLSALDMPNNKFNLSKSGYFYKYDFEPEDVYYLDGKLPKEFTSTDHLGTLQVTRPFNSLTGIKPIKVADEIVTCRERLKSVHTDIDYSSIALGGSIKTWAQFNLFMDSLVQAGFFDDNRDKFYDGIIDPDSESNIANWAKAGQSIDIPIKAQTSKIQKRIGSQAIADVLKANFNPNLNLNELNPNKSIWTLVDKTDLIVNSTEFCFLPMGYFQVNSTGEHQVDGKTIAAKTASCTVKLYDVYYETTQKEFYEGKFSINGNMGIKTNNAYIVETGPESDNGKAPQECNYSGYLALSTYLGVFSSPKAKGELGTTYEKAGVYDASVKRYAGMQLSGAMPSDGYYSDLHVHFTLDHVAHFHRFQMMPPTWSWYDKFKDKYTLPIGPFEGTFREWTSMEIAQIVKESKICNYCDREESTRSPYSAINLVNGQERHRLCRAFKVGQSGYEYEPSDLRVDGAYFEFNSGVSYYTPFQFPREDELDASELFVTTKTYSFDKLPTQMFVSFYVKPNFHPECSERMRQFFTTNGYGWSGHYEGGGIYLHGLYWTPSYQTDFNKILPLNIFSFPPRTSLVYSARLSSVPHPNDPFWYVPVYLPLGSWEAEFGSSHQVLTGPLNYESDSEGGNEYNRYLGANAKFNKFRSNEWVHIMLEARKEQDNQFRLNTGKVYINGEAFSENVQTVDSYYWGNSWANFLLKLRYGPFITIGGECTSAFNWEHDEVKNTIWGYNTPKPVPRYYYSDSTVDEFFLWFSDNPLNNTRGYNFSEMIFNAYGRYYKSGDDKLGDISFTSSPKKFNNVVKFLGVSWTVYAEDYNISGNEIKSLFYNWQSTPSTEMIPSDHIDGNGFKSNSPALLKFTWLDSNNAKCTTDYFGNDGYSVIQFQGKAVLQKEFNYQIKFRTGFQDIDKVNVTLLSTPIFDDITIFYSQGSPLVLYYTIS